MYLDLAVSWPCCVFFPDIPLCKGLVDVKIDPHRLNCVEFVWDPRQIETKVAIKIHCISTEFTAKKHGGEKGVPFRVQVETYTYSPTPPDYVPLLLHCASCQIKVFKVRSPHCVLENYNLLTNSHDAQASSRCLSGDICPSISVVRNAQQ